MLIAAILICLPAHPAPIPKDVTPVGVWKETSMHSPILMKFTSDGKYYSYYNGLHWIGTWTKQGDYYILTETILDTTEMKPIHKYRFQILRESNKTFLFKTDTYKFIIKRIKDES